MCISVGWFFLFFCFVFLLFYKKWSPQAMRFIFSVGLTMNHHGSGFIISQTIRGENTITHINHILKCTNTLNHIWTPGVHKHKYYTHDTWCRHTHTHARTRTRTHQEDLVSHTLKFMKATRTTGKKRFGQTLNWFCFSSQTSWLFYRCDTHINRQ